MCSASTPPFDARHSRTTFGRVQPTNRALQEIMIWKRIRDVQWCKGLVRYVAESQPSQIFASDVKLLSTFSHHCKVSVHRFIWGQKCSYCNVMWHGSFVWTFYEAYELCLTTWCLINRVHFITRTLHVKLLRLQSIGNISTEFLGEVQLVRYGLVDGGWVGSAASLELIRFEIWTGWPRWTSSSE